MTLAFTRMSRRQRDNQPRASVIKRFARAPDIGHSTGVTDEYIGSHYFKHLTQLEMTYRDTLHHLGQVSERMTESAGVFA